MNVEVTKLPESRVELKIQLSEEEVEQALDRTYKQLVQRVNVPGFRKGKAPRSVVERMVGADFFLHEATDEAIRWGYRKAVDQENLTPISQAEIDTHADEDADDETAHDEEHVRPGHVFDFGATVAVKPEVTLPDYQAIHIERQVEQVTDEDVAALLENIRQSNATLEPVVRPAQIGDVITMNVTGRADGEEVLNNESADFELRDEESGEPDPALPGLAAQLVGVDRGEIREVSLELPELYRDPEIAGKTLFLRILVKEIKRKVLPELDDDLAQSVSDRQSLDDLRDLLRKNLEAERMGEADQRLVQQAVQEVTSRTFIDIPPILIEEDLDRSMDEMREMLEQRGLSFQSYLDMSQRNEADIRNDMRESATESVKTSLVLSAVADREGIEITNADVSSALDDLLRATNAGSGERREMRASASVRSNLRSRLRRQRAINKLVEIMTGGDTAARDAAETLAGQAAATSENADETVAVEVGG